MSAEPSWLTPTVRLIVERLLSQSEDDGWIYGLDLIEETELASGQVFPVLRDLARAGWAESKWESSGGDSESPRKRLYRATRDGAAAWNLLFHHDLVGEAPTDATPGPLAWTAS